MFKIMHQSVEEKVEEFKQSMRRITYVTPTSYLELLSSYKKLLKAQRTKVEKGINRLGRGLEVLKTAAVEVDKLQRQLEESAPVLAETQIQVEKTKKVIAEETTKAEAIKSVVVVEEEEASKQAAEVKEIKDKADNELN
jgi:dynein heavy chain